MKLLRTACTIGLLASSPFIYADYDGLTTDYRQWANDYNFRDVAKSLNTACEFNAPTYDGDGGELKKDKTKFRFVENLLLRSNIRFSGKQCSLVGNPQLILDLRYDPQEGTTSKCIRSNNTVLNGTYFNTTGEVLHQVEAMEFQADAKKADICRYFKEGFASIAANKPVLVHCASGKDRTGAYVAMMAYAMLETMGLSSDDFTNAQTRITCDYLRSGLSVWGPRRAPSMFPLSFIVNYDSKYGSEVAYFVNECNIDEALIKKAAGNFIKKS